LNRRAHYIRINGGKISLNISFSQFKNQATLNVQKIKEKGRKTPNIEKGGKNPLINVKRFCSCSHQLEHLKFLVKDFEHARITNLV
jgi:hypothetical protein